MQWEVNADDPRGYDMVLMDDWESQIVFDSYNPLVVAYPLFFLRDLVEIPINRLRSTARQRSDHVQMSLLLTTTRLRTEIGSKGSSGMPLVHRLQLILAL